MIVNLILTVAYALSAALAYGWQISFFSNEERYGVSVVKGSPISLRVTFALIALFGPLTLFAWIVFVVSCGVSPWRYGWKL